MDHQFRFQLIREIAESSSESDPDSSDNYIESSSEDDEIIKKVIFRRSLHSKIYTSRMIPKSNSWYKNVLFKYDEKRFRTTLRMNRQTFWMIVNIIKDHEVFSDKQNPVELHLSITLFLLGRRPTIWDVA